MEAASSALWGEVRVYSCERMRLTSVHLLRRTQPLVRFRGEADVNRQVRPVGPVENDPKRTLAGGPMVCPPKGTLCTFRRIDLTRYNVLP
jgi:hypothetical protein